MDFFENVIIEYKDLSISLLQIVLATISLITAFILVKVINSFLNRNNSIKSYGEINVKTLKKFILLFVILLGFYAALESLGINVSSFLQKNIIKTEKFSFNFFHIIVIYLIYVVTKLVLSIIDSIISAKEQANHIEKGKTRSVYQIIKYFIYVLAFAIFVQSLGINITILIASLSALLLGLGLGIQHLFTDLVSGFIILFDRTIKIGDIVEIKDELVGKVESINLRTSTLITRDDIEIIIPNSKFTSDNIINWTHNSLKSRFHIKVGVAYGSDVRLVERILLEVTNNHKDIVLDPKPTVHFIDFGDSSLDFKLFFFSEVAFRIESIKSELRFEIDKKFRENNVTIPFPQRDVHFYKHD